MANNSNGQIQYLIMDSLKDGAKYGLEIIEYISSKTNGGYVLKKPTLYSCLTRLEKKGYLSSSYWGESEFGGKRHYYTLTSTGKDTLATLAKEFANASFDNLVGKEEKEEKPVQTEQKPVFLEQKNLFDLAKPEKKAETETPVPENNVVKNQIDIFSLPPTQNVEKEQTTNDTQTAQSAVSEASRVEVEAPKQDDARFLESHEKLETKVESQLAQNKRIYDTSADLRRYRNRKSFADNQIEMSVVYENKPDDDQFKANIESLKKSILQTKQNTFDKNEYANLFKESNAPKEVIPEKTAQNTTAGEFLSASQKIYTKPQQETQKEPVQEEKNDAVLITTPQYTQGNVPYQRRITPPDIEISISNDNLPAPIRNAELEPTYKDMMSKIMEKKKEKNTQKEQAPAAVKIETVQENSNFADYATLRAYYKTHGIEFKEYKKSNVERIHNTNFVNFAVSLVLLLLCCAGNAIIFWIVSASGKLMASTNFMYYTIPVLFAIYSIYLFIVHKCQASRKAAQKYNAVVNWAVFLLACIVVIVLNICFGMQIETMADYLTSLLLPIFAILLIFPVNHYITKFAYKKFSK